jgi:hypothetical protein
MGIEVEDPHRDALLNARFKPLMGGLAVPPSLIVNCTESIPDLDRYYKGRHSVPIKALSHARHQAWHGLDPYINRPRPEQFYVLVHVSFKIEYIMICGPWTRVHRKRVIFDLTPAGGLDPMNLLLGQDIRYEVLDRLPVDQQSQHSALLLNPPVGMALKSALTKP